jgi:hypothetical protein
MRANVKLLSPWIEPHSPDGLELELQREVAPEHALHGKSATALAVARDRDDVLFAVNEADSLPYAVVYLTWSGKAELGRGRRRGFSSRWSNGSNA